MTPKRTAFFLALAGAVASLATVSAGEPCRGSASLCLELTGSLDDGPRLGYQLMRTFMSANEWATKVADVRRKFSTWEQDNHADIGRYLNDRLVIVALSAAEGKIEDVQRGIAFLALYRELGEQAPTVVTKFLLEHKGSMTRLLKDFTWEKASDYVKNRGWREDIAERRRLSQGAAAQETAAAPQPAPAPRAATSAAAPAAETPLRASAGRLTCLELLALDWRALTAPENDEALVSASR